MSASSDAPSWYFSSDVKFSSAPLCGPPSNKKAIQQFIRVGKQMGLQLETITSQDFNRLAEYDALFIRETTSLTHHTYQFAKKAESEDMVVVDDPSSILKCTNKIYLLDATCDACAFV